MWKHRRFPMAKTILKEAALQGSQDLTSDVLEPGRQKPALCDAKQTHGRMKGAEVPDRKSNSHSHPSLDKCTENMD